IRPNHGSGTVPATLNCVRHGTPLVDSSQWLTPAMLTRKFGFVAAPLHVFATLRSVADPPKMRIPRGRRAFTLNSNALYFCERFGSLVITFCTARDTVALIGSYIVIGLPSIGLKIVTGR